MRSTVAGDYRILVAVLLQLWVPNIHPAHCDIEEKGNADKLKFFGFL